MITVYIMRENPRLYLIKITNNMPGDFDYARCDCALKFILTVLLIFHMKHCKAVVRVPKNSIFIVLALPLFTTKICAQLVPA
jgi:hypothetical protein